MPEGTRQLIKEALTPEGKSFMSGLAGIVLASVLCDNGIDVYGYSTGEDPPGTRYHYYDKVVPDVQDAISESALELRMMAQQYPDCIRVHEHDSAHRL